MLFGSPGGDTRMMNTSKTDRDVSAPPPVDEQIARIIEQAQEQGLQLTGEGGLLPDMIKAAVEAALSVTELAAPEAVSAPTVKVAAPVP